MIPPNAHLDPTSIWFDPRTAERPLLAPGCWNPYAPPKDAEWPRIAREAASLLTTDPGGKS